MMNLNVLPLLAGLLSLLPAPAQVAFERLGPAQGMPQSTLHALHQDREGFLWMATRDGLNRYDGQTFRTWRREPDRPGSLRSSDVSVVGGDRAGRTWVGTINGGLYYLNPDGRTFTHFPTTATGADVSRRTINCLAQAADGRIWAATAGQGWLVADARTGRVDEFRLVDAAEHPQIIGHLADRDGSLWFGLEGGLLVHFPRGAAGPVTFRLPGRAPTPRQATVTAIFRDRRGNLWVGTRNGGLYRFREAAGQFEPVYREPGVAGKGNFVKCLAEDRQGTLWVGTDDGIRLLPGGDPRRVMALHPNPADPRSLATHPIQCLLADREGNVWVGTWEGGLHVAYAEPPRFEMVGDRPGAGPPGPPPKITALALDPAGRLWAGSVRGISRFTGGQGPNAPAGTLVPVTPPVSPGSTDIFTLFTGRRGDVYASYWDGGVVRYPPAGRPSLLDLSVPAARHAVAFAQAADGRVWIVRYDHHLLRYDPATGRTAAVGYLPRLLGLPVTLAVTCAFEAPDGWLWLGTYTHGLVGWHGASGAVRHFSARGGPATLGDDHVTCLAPDGKGGLWVGTYGGGLNRFDPRRGTFRRFTSRHGLAGDVVMSLVTDAAGHLWVATTGGLSRLDPATGRCLGFAGDDGLPTTQFTDGTAVRLPAGRLAFGTTTGLLLVYPGRFATAPPPPRAYLSDLALFNRPVETGAAGAPLQKALPATGHLVLNAQQTVFTLGFGALGLGRNRHVRYAFRLDGFDPDWSYPDGATNTTYTNLDPGTYTFRLKAGRRGEGWGPERRLQITILPPWYKTRPAVGLYVVLLLGVVLLIQRIIRVREKLKADLRVRQLEAESIRALDEARTHFFTNISHEFRTPLTLILTPLEKLLAEDPPAPDRLHYQFRLMHRNADRLLRLINQLLDLSKLESGTLHPCLRSLDLAGHLENVVHAFDGLAEARGVGLALHVHPGPRQALFDADLVEKIVSNLLANALRYTPAGGRVTVEARNTGETLRLVVADTGKGIPDGELPHLFRRFYQGNGEGRTGTGIGLALVRELTELLGGTVAVQSRPGAGSAFTVTLPAAEGAFRAEWLSHSPDPPLPVPEETTGPLPGVPEPPGGKPMLLVAEDDAELRDYLRTVFAPHYHVLTAADGETALQLAGAHLPDAVVTDWMMPGLEGPELCRRLKHDEKTCHIPVVLLTSRSGPPSQLAGLAAGADDYVAKPFHATLLLQRVHNLVQNRLRLRRAFGRPGWLPPGNPPANRLDESFLQKVAALVEEHLDDPHFDAEQLQEVLNLSQMQLYRKLKSLTDLSARDFIRYVRLQRAAQLLQGGGLGVSEVAYRVGFNDPAYFSRSFKKQFGQSPLEYARSRV